MLVKLHWIKRGDRALLMKSLDLKILLITIKENTGGYLVTDKVACWQDAHRCGLIWLSYPCLPLKTCLHWFGEIKVQIAGNSAFFSNPSGFFELRFDSFSNDFPGIFNIKQVPEPSAENHASLRAKTAESWRVPDSSLDSSCCCFTFYFILD